jgi:hypothetical protein
LKDGGLKSKIHGRLPKKVQEYLLAIYAHFMRRKTPLRLIKDRYSQRRAIEKLRPDTKRLIVFLSPGFDVVSGGILSINSLYKETQKLRDLHDSEVIMCNCLGEPPLIRYSGFKNTDILYNFFDVITYFKKLEFLMIHIPEYHLHSFVEDFKKIEPKLVKIRNIHFNILLQNIDALPYTAKQDINLLKNRGKVTAMTAHEAYTTKQLSEKLGIPLHYFRGWNDAFMYNKRTFDEKKDIMIVSPDVHPQKEKILDKIRKSFPSIKIVVIKNMNYEEYKELISWAKWAVTFGEGLDGYFTETIFSGGISFAVYNDRFFTEDFKKLRTVYKDYYEMEKKICDDIRELSARDKYVDYQAQQYNIKIRHNSYQEYLMLLKLFYQGVYTIDLSH